MVWQISNLILTLFFALGDSKSRKDRHVHQPFAKKSLRTEECPVAFEVVYLQSMTNTPNGMIFVRDSLYMGLDELAESKDPILDDLKLAVGYFGDTRAPYFGVGTYFGGYKDGTMKKDVPYVLLNPLSTDLWQAVDDADFMFFELTTGGDIPNNLNGAVLSALVDPYVGFSADKMDSKNRHILKVVIAATDSIAHKEDDLEAAVNRYNSNFCKWGQLPDDANDSLFGYSCKPGSDTHDLCKGNLRDNYDADNMSESEKEDWQKVVDNCGPFPIDVTKLQEHPLQKDEAAIDYWKPPQISLVKKALEQHEQMHVATINFNSKIMTFSEADKYMDCTGLKAESVEECLKYHHGNVFGKADIPGSNVSCSVDTYVDGPILDILYDIANGFCEKQLQTTNEPKENGDNLGCADCVKVNRGKLYMRFDKENMPKEIAALVSKGDD